MSARKKERPALTPEEIVFALAELNAPSPLAQDLMATPLDLVKTILRDSYQVEIDDTELTPTYFFPRSMKKKVGQIVGQDFTMDEGAFIPKINSIVLFERGEPTKDSHNFFHEQTHAFSHHIVVTDTGNVAFFRVGYLYHSNLENNSYRHGEFLEETIVDHLSHKMNVAFWANRGRNILADNEPRDYTLGYAFLSVAIQHLFSKVGPDMEKLMVQARFEPKLRGGLYRQLNQKFGPGTSTELVHLGIDNFDEIRILLEDVFDNPIIR